MEDLFETETQFKLSKNSYLTVGGIRRQCVQFLSSQKGTPAQSLVIGDARGVIYITQYKKSEPEILLRTPPYPKEVSCIIVKPDTMSDKIYFSVGNSIYVINRTNTIKYKIEFDILAACFTLMAIWRHRENIRRLLNGTENKLGQKAK